LRKREWNRANGQKQKQIKRAPDEMRFDGGINLFFHVGSLIKRSLSRFWIWTPYRLQKTIGKSQYNVLQSSGFFGESVPRRNCGGTIRTHNVDCSESALPLCSRESRVSR
jgi:hypothetical protein